MSLLISKKHPLLAPVLVSEFETYSGLALIINLLQYLPFYSIFISFALLIISLIAKYIEPNAIKIILIQELFSFAFLAISRPASFTSEILWGFWITLVIVIALIICDIIIMRRKRI